MIDLSKLIELLPSFFKHNDTYKDKEGKGILERFLNICGEYFKDISNQVDNYLDIIDLDFNTKDLLDSDEKKQYEHLFLNNIWEFLGEIPYGYSALYDDTRPNNPWITNASIIPRAECRRLLKYAISLYKIRGTLDFYNILLRFYDMNCKVLDPSGTLQVPKGFSGRIFRDINGVKFNGNTDDYLGIKEIGESYDSGMYYDSDSLYDLDDSKYDYSVDCLGCTTVYLSITTKTTLSSDSKKKVLLLLNRFRPVNTVPFDLNNTNFICYT